MKEEHRNAVLLDTLATIAGASWCAGLEKRDETWELVIGMASGKKAEVQLLLEYSSIQGLLDTAAAAGKPRTRKLPPRLLLRPVQVARITVFPAPSGQHAILAGSGPERIRNEAMTVLQVFSRNMTFRFPTPGPSAATQTAESIRQEFLYIVEKMGGLDITELDLQSVLRRLSERTCELLGAKGIELGLVDKNRTEVRVLWSDLRGENPGGYSIPLGEDVIGMVAAGGHVLQVNDYSGWRERSLEPAGCTLAIGIPLRYEEQLIGALAVFDDTPGRAFSNQDVRLLELLASQATTSIRNARLFQELGERIKAQRAAEKRMVETARLAATGEMAASIAHELNNPLTVISGFSELLLDEFPEGSRQRENMALVLQEARRARQVVRRLLDFSRREKGLKTPIDVTEAVSDVLALAQPMAQGQGVEIQFEAWEGLPEVMGDRSQLRQVLMNLVSNGIQSMAQGGKLLVRTSMPSSEQGSVSILVRDEGAGIPPEYMDQIFDPFFTTKPVGSGTGLGLSISRNIVAEHGGEIRVASREGEGASFTVLLPIDGAAIEGRDDQR